MLGAQLPLRRPQSWIYVGHNNAKFIFIGLLGAGQLFYKYLHVLILCSLKFWGTTGYAFE